jgi:hypothetical protein
MIPLRAGGPLVSDSCGQPAALWTRLCSSLNRGKLLFNSSVSVGAHFLGVDRKRKWRRAEIRIESMQQKKIDGAFSAQSLCDVSAVNKLFLVMCMRVAHAAFIIGRC